MDRCALFVDAGYVLADGAMAVHGTRHRESASWDYAGLLQLLSNLACERTGMPLLRCYWYEAAVEGRRTPDHDALADLPSLKLRLGRMRPGSREGVDAEVHRDLSTLARNHAISDAVIVSAEDDLAHVIGNVQDLGVRVTLVNITVDGNWTISRLLRQECDAIIEIGGVHLRPHVKLIAGAEPAMTQVQYQPQDQYLDRQFARAPLANGHATVGRHGAEAVLPAGLLPSLPSSYTSQPAASKPGYGPVRHDAAGPQQVPVSQNLPTAAGVQARRELMAASAGAEAQQAQAQQAQAQVEAQAQQAQAQQAQAQQAQAQQAQAQQAQAQVEAQAQQAQAQQAQQAQAQQAQAQAQQAKVQQVHAQMHAAPTPAAPVPALSAQSQVSGTVPAFQDAKHRVPASGSGLSAPPVSAASVVPAAAAQPGAQPMVQPTAQPGIQPTAQPGAQPGPYLPPQHGPLSGPQPVAPPPVSTPAVSATLADATAAAHAEGLDFGGSVARDAPALWLEAVLARKPRMPSDLEARLLQGSSLPIDFLLHDEVRHALRRGFWDALERSRR